MAGLVPAIHVFDPVASIENIILARPPPAEALSDLSLKRRGAWMAGTSPAMTTEPEATLQEPMISTLFPNT